MPPMKIESRGLTCALRKDLASRKKDLESMLVNQNE